MLVLVINMVLLYSCSLCYVCVFCLCTGPTLKLRRPVVSQMYRETIASLYAEPKALLWDHETLKCNYYLSESCRMNVWVTLWSVTASGLHNHFTSDVFHSVMGLVCTESCCSLFWKCVLEFFSTMSTIIPSPICCPRSSWCSLHWTCELLVLSTQLLMSYESGRV